MRTEIRLPRRVFVGVTAAAFLTGFALQALLPDTHRPTIPPSSSPSSAESTAAADPGPTRITNRAPAGFARTQSGAIAAAASFVTTGQLLLDLDPLAAGDVVRQMATAATADRQVADVLGQLAAVRDQLSHGTGPIAFRQGVVSYRVERYSDQRARVAVWNVGVLSRAGVAPPQAAWAISTLELIWERDDWHLDAETIVPGPAPLLDDSAAPATAAAFTSALDGFTAFGVTR